MEIVYKGKKHHITATIRDSGKERIIFLHGLGCSQESFTDAWKSKVLQKYSLLSFDFLGHGSSPKPEDFSYTMEDHAEIAYMLVQQTKAQHVHIVGHSMGGAIGLLLAEKLKSKVKTMISVEGNLVKEDCTISRKASSISYAQFCDTFFDQLQQDLERSEEKGMRFSAQLVKQSSPYAFYKSAKSLVTWSDSGKLMKKFQSLPVKKAYMYGEKNAVFLDKLITKLDPIPSFSISRSGHAVMNDTPKD